MPPTSSAVPEQPRQEYTAKREGHRARAHQASDPQVRGPLAQVNESAERFGDRGDNQVAAHRGQRWDAKEEHQYRRHEGTAAHAGKPDHDRDGE